MRSSGWFLACSMIVPLASGCGPDPAPGPGPETFPIATRVLRPASPTCVAGGADEDLARRLGTDLARGSPGPEAGDAVLPQAAARDIVEAMREVSATGPARCAGGEPWAAALVRRWAAEREVRP